MRNAKEATGTGTKATVKGGGRRMSGGILTRTTRTASASKTVRAQKAPAKRRPSISEAQSKVVASKFHTEVEAPTSKPRPSLPSSYGESHLLLLVRDPQALFAAWDMSPLAIESLKARIGARAFAVSTLTLRLTRAGGSTSVVHVGKKARSRYLRIDGGPSYLGEIGFTTPTGRFELVARSAPCFVPVGPSRQESVEAVSRAVLGYREARALARRETVNTPEAVTSGRSRAAASGSGGSASPIGSKAARVLGGASDLYRR